MAPLTLKQQLALLEDDSNINLDPEDAYSSLDAIKLFKGQPADDDAYLDVGPSKLRSELGNRDQVLLSDKYAGKTVRRKKIFDDDDEESVEDDGLNGLNGAGSEDDEDDDMNDHSETSDDYGDESNHHTENFRARRSGLDLLENDEDDYNEPDERDGDEDEDEEEEEEGDEEEVEEVQNDNEDEEKDDEQDDGHLPQAGPSKLRSNQAMDPVGALREARAKDVERGRAIRRQKVRRLSSSFFSILSDACIGIVRRGRSTSNHIPEGSLGFPVLILPFAI